MKKLDLNDYTLIPIDENKFAIAKNDIVIYSTISNLKVGENYKKVNWGALDAIAILKYNEKDKNNIAWKKVLIDVLGDDLCKNYPEYLI